MTTPRMTSEWLGIAPAAPRDDLNQCGACDAYFETFEEVFSHDCAAIPAPTSSIAQDVIDHLASNRPNGSGSRTRAESPAPVDLPEMSPADVEAWLLGLGRKVEVADVTTRLARAATIWARAYTGDFAFMIDMRDAATSRRTGLSTGQAKGTLNCWRADVLRNQARAARPAASATPAPVQDVSDGFYVTADGSTIWKVQIAVHGSGHPYAKVLNVHTGRFDYAQGAIRTIARGLADGTVAPLTLDRARELGHLYGRCMVCGRTLTDENSIDQGIGPVCARRF